ncbi:MAG: Beta-lactamase, partial [uncultured Rubrobacteraceae bacterium]
EAEGRRGEIRRWSGPECPRGVGSTWRVPRRAPRGGPRRAARRGGVRCGRGRDVSEREPDQGSGARGAPAGGGFGPGVGWGRGGHPARGPGRGFRDARGEGASGAGLLGGACGGHDHGQRQHGDERADPAPRNGPDRRARRRTRVAAHFAAPGDDGFRRAVAGGGEHDLGLRHGGADAGDLGRVYARGRIQEPPPRALAGPAAPLEDTGPAPTRRPLRPQDGGARRRGERRRYSPRAGPELRGGRAGRGGRGRRGGARAGGAPVHLRVLRRRRSGV